MPGKPKTPFFIVVGVIVLGLVVFGLRGVLFPSANTGGGGNIDPNELGGGAAEAQDDMTPTTVSEYQFVPAATLPPVAGVSAYREMEDDTVRFALNVWAGWSPIIQANNGFRAGKIWKTPGGKQFKVELVLIDDPVAMRDAYAAGEVHIGWATLDMMPLFLEGFVDQSGKPKDSRIMPRVFQQVDWSNGGDGIVVRSAIKTVGDLRGKKIVLAQNSPSHYFALNMLVTGGVQPSEVQWTFTNDAFQAAAAFNAQKDIAAAVSWAPDIYSLSEVRGNRMLVDTTVANKLIADVWFARADFAKDHLDIIEGLVRGIFDAMVELKSDAARQNVAKLMGEGYNLPADEALAMLGDAHSTNWAENYQFFVNQNNPANFETVWRKAYYLYRKIRSVTHRPVPFNQVMDFSLIQKLGKEPKYANQKNEYQVHYPLRTAGEIRGEADEVITQVEFIKFAPNNWDLYHKVTRNIDGKDVEQLYYPQADLVLKGIAETVGQFGMASVIIEGHADSSMKGRVSASLAKELSLRRANAVKEALVRNHDLDPDQFAVDGVGWGRPLDPDDPLNHSKNRRVEIKIYPAELK